jgi:SAM-dependent methyltransferase
LVVKTIRRLLAHPETRSLEVDDPQTTLKRHEVISSNKFLWRIYDEWYRLICACIPDGLGAVLELGSGAGFLGKYIPEVLRSDVFFLPHLDIVSDARCLPFAASSIKSIVLVNVLHHVSDVKAFLAEAQRCLRPSGSILMIEPWVSTWSRLIYTQLHHEPFDPKASEWSVAGSGPLSAANGALPWIVFERDRRRFEYEFPDLQIHSVTPLMPFRYLVSGGISMRQLMPEATFSVWRKIETFVLRWPQSWSMFALIHLKRPKPGVPGVASAGRRAF